VTLNCSVCAVGAFSGWCCNELSSVRINVHHQMYNFKRFELLCYEALDYVQSERRLRCENRTATIYGAPAFIPLHMPVWGKLPGLCHRPTCQVGSTEGVCVTKRRAAEVFGIQS
jgi:hypothetical protein